ncbi:hypothetical protein NUW54_g14455 [Trametes sanguinea]|uniref:Uncharacterized protein n=1 Tax=Trametes sanguinea TaxID=158606 RepID=A0ACC1MCZ1_9APHY|nr:hypothetical protein NUW54_g14455 [Trametes sanguinea]
MPIPRIPTRRSRGCGSSSGGAATPPPEPEPTKEKGKAPAVPERDSPENPFLFGGSPASVPASEDPESPVPRTPKKHVEMPTITYVLCVSATFTPYPCPFGRTRFPPPIATTTDVWILLLTAAA